MKKLLKLFGLLLAMGTLFCLSSCDDLLGLNGEDNTQQAATTTTTTDNEVLEHTFVMDMADKDPAKQIYIYYTSTTRFSYPDHPNCYYQVVFNKQGNKWSMYTRPVESMNKINDVASGTYGKDESVITEGTVTLSDKETITIKKNSEGKLYFTANVYASHKAIGAKDDK